MITFSGFTFWLLIDRGTVRVCDASVVPSRLIRSSAASLVMEIFIAKKIIIGNYM